MGQEAAKGREGLLAILDARYRGPLMSFFLRRTGSREDAEDLTQETFVRLLASSEAGRLENAEAFVFKVAANLLTDRARRGAVRGKRLSISEDEAAAEQIADLVEERAPERVLLGREELARALSALDELGERTRDIFILARMEHMKQRDIAQLFGIAVSTVEKHLMRAMLHLAKRCSDK
ncbi:MAG TPA: sigma-70 family RNA polymerase sigma factor [Vitreimonas sp.]|uniref:RNA polymerase sigma factor n=1 Tax=Vitreimonas sp. TaxID=3069702 RepID=UPI002D2D3D7C|nr:sigma-70 family RNA polymerase sigma factor [Vitreimonas sp.]HYD86043.1 sigma-70 family RNA polymerase sigma factor [Vitreimonas sp.]